MPHVIDTYLYSDPSSPTGEVVIEAAPVGVFSPYQYVQSDIGSVIIEAAPVGVFSPYQYVPSDIGSVIIEAAPVGVFSPYQYVPSDISSVIIEAAPVGVFSPYQYVPSAIGNVAIASALLQVAQPVILQPTGTYEGFVNVTISCATPGIVRIRYTTDGSTPDDTSNLYSAPLHIVQTTTINAIAYKDGMAPSSYADPKTYTIQAAAPVILPATGTYISSTSVTISCSTPGSTIRYTTDGSVPDGTSTLYSVPFDVMQTSTIKAIAYSSGMIASDYAVDKTYTIQVATPVILPATGAYVSPISVTISCSTPGARIRYTTDGSTPDDTSNLYSAAFNVTQATTIKAIAYNAGMIPSGYAVPKIYTIAVAVPQVTIVNISDNFLSVGESAIVTWNVDENCTRWAVELGGSGILGTGTVLGGAIVNIPANVDQTFQIDASSIPGGTSTLYLYAVDGASVVGYTSFELTLDNQIPVITIHEIYRHTMATHETATIIWTTSVGGIYDVRCGGVNPGQGVAIASGVVAIGETIETPVSETQLVHNVLNNIRVYVTTPGGMVGTAMASMTVDDLPPNTVIIPRGSEGPFSYPFIATIIASDYAVPGVVINAADSDVAEDIGLITPNSIMRPNMPGFNTEAGVSPNKIDIGSYTIPNPVIDGNGDLPTGQQVFLGVPFNLPVASAPDNYTTWVGQTGNYSLGIPLDLYGATTVYIIINSMSCDVDPSVGIIFDATNSVSFEKQLYNNVDIRDYNNDINNVYANSINGTTTRNVWTNGTQRLDMVQIDLPIAFATETLNSVSITCARKYEQWTPPPFETGQWVVQPSFVKGITIVAYDANANTNPVIDGYQYIPSDVNTLVVGHEIVVPTNPVIDGYQYIPSDVNTLAIWQQVSTPIIRDAGNNEIFPVVPHNDVEQGTLIHITCDTTGASIYYTTDNSEPTEASLLVTLAGYYVDNNVTIRTKAFRAGCLPSIESGITFVVEPVYVASPVITPVEESHQSFVNVAIACGTSGAIIHYAIDGVVSQASPIYSAPIHITHTAIITAMATMAHMTQSAISSKTYTIQEPSISMPIISDVNYNEIHQADSPVTIPQGTLIHITCTTPADIHYTDNGDEPTLSSPISSGEYILDTDVTIKVKAFAGGESSPENSITFIVTPVYVLQPMFNPAPGDFNNTVDVTITSGTAGAEIRYALNAIPSISDPVYDGSLIHLTATTTINAIASKQHMTTSSNNGTFTKIVPAALGAYNIIIHPYRTTCVIRWTTPVPCICVVDYGLAMAYDMSTPEYGTVAKTQHQVLLTGLAPSTNYHFSITGHDADSNTFATSDDVFVTQANRDTRIAIYATNDGTIPRLSPLPAVFTHSALGEQLSVNINRSTTLKFFAVDGFGNQQPVQTEVYSLDNVPPMITVDHLLPGVIGLNGIAILRFKVNEQAKFNVKNQIGTVLATNENSPGMLDAETWVDVQLHSVDMVEGFNHITITATDIYENSASVLCGHVIRDTIAPDVEPSKVAGYYNSDIYVDLIPRNLRDGEKIIIYYTVDGTLPNPLSRRSGINENQIYNILISETTTIRWYSIDEVGNEELKKYATYIIDRQRPIIMATPLPDTYDEAIDVQLLANEPATIYYTIDGTIPTDALNESTYIYDARRPIEVIQDMVITAFAKDLAGNVSDVKEFAYQINALRDRKFKKVIGFQDKILLETEFNEAQDNINRRVEEMALEVIGAKCIAYGFDIQKTFAPQSFEFYVQRGKAYVGGKFVTVHRNDMCMVPDLAQVAGDKTFHLILKPRETIFKPARPGQPGWEEGVPEITTYRLEENYVLEVVENLPRVEDLFIELYSIVRPLTAQSIQDCEFIDRRGDYKFDDIVNFQSRTRESIDLIESNLLALGLEVESYKLRNLLGLKNAVVDTFESLKDIDTTKSQSYRHVNTRFEL